MPHHDERKLPAMVPSEAEALRGKRNDENLNVSPIKPDYLEVECTGSS